MHMCMCFHYTSYIYMRISYVKLLNGAPAEVHIDIEAVVRSRAGSRRRSTVGASRRRRRRGQSCRHTAAILRHQSNQVRLEHLSPYD